MKRGLVALPIIVLLAFGALALVQLLRPQKGDFERVSRAAPIVSFDRMGGGRLSFSPPPEGQAIAVNLFASWCGPCEAEHDKLKAIAARHPDRLYGVLYKDTPENGAAFLDRLGNPYRDVVLDPDGSGGLDFGLTGVPETFVVSADDQCLPSMICSRAAKTFSFSS